MSRSKHWSWEYYITDGQLFRNNNYYKNAWCIACLNHHRDQLRQSDIVSTALNGVGGDRTDAEREAQARINSLPISGKPGQSMVPHLAKCGFVAPDVRARAVEENNGKKSRRENPLLLGRSASLPLPAIATGLGYAGYQTASLIASATPPQIPSPLILSAPLLNLERPPKRPRTTGFTGPDGSPSLVGRVWNPPLQQEFGGDFCKLLIATCSSWNTAHNPQVRLFVEKWIPGAIVPDLRTLSGPILDREAGKVKEKLKLKLKGRKATLQTDGWESKSKQAIVATMVNVDFKPYLMQTHDVSTQPKTGEALLKLVTEDIKWSEETYGLVVIAACSDDGSDARKMRRLLLALMPWLIISLCWAHQINLIVGDYLALKLPFLDCVSKASKVIKWMNNHSRALELFRQEQLYTYQKVLTLIHPVLARWTAHYLSLRRLLTVETALRATWIKYDDTMIASAGSKSDEKVKAIKVQKIIEDLDFWYHVKITCSHLEPLAIAANITQASNTRLYHVLTTLANLYRIYSNLNLDEHLRDQVLGSLEKRWAAADQDPFIAAVILNPFLRGNCFGQHEALTPIGLCNMLKCLQFRVFRIDADADFQTAFMDYYDRREEFSLEAMALVDWAEIAKEKRQEVNPIEVWEAMDTLEETGRNRLTKLAIHILSVVASSTGHERAFSHTGLVHTGIHSKLGVEKFHKTTMVGMDIERMHFEASLLHSRGKQNFTSGEQGPDHKSDRLATDHLDVDNNDNLLDFDQLSERLIAGAAAANGDRDVGDDDNDELPPVLAPSLTVTIPPLDSATLLSHRANQVKKTSIPLKILFKYPTDIDPPLDGMNSFWRGGIQNLEKEMEAYEILSSNGDNVDGT